MKKFLFPLLTLCVVIGTKAQVGINTTNPQGIFDIDASKNNVGTTPTADLLKDDIIVLSDGRVGIGALPATAETAKLLVNGKVKTTTLDLNSDIRYKTDIKKLYESDKLKDLVPVMYYWNDLGKTRGGDDKLQYGFIAQEIEKVYPDLVNTDGDGYKSVNYIQLIPVLTEALQEERRLNETQRTQIDALETRIKLLEAKLTK